MFNVTFEKNSQPITDGELVEVARAIQPVVPNPLNSHQEISLLLAKMIFRIEALKSELARSFPCVKDAA